MNELGQKQPSGLKIRAHRVQRRDQKGVDDVQRLLAPLQRGTGRVLCLSLQPGAHHLVQRAAGGCGSRGRAGGDVGGHIGIGVGGDIVPGIGVHIHQQVVGAHRRHHGVHIGVDDGQVKAVHHGHREEVLVDDGPGRQTEGDVGHAQHCFQPQLLLDHTQSQQSLIRPLLLRAGGEGEAVNVHIFLSYPTLQRRLQNPLRDGKAALGALGNPHFVQSTANNGCAVFFHDG